MHQPSVNSQRGFFVWGELLYYLVVEIGPEKLVLGALQFHDGPAEIDAVVVNQTNDQLAACGTAIPNELKHSKLVEKLLILLIWRVNHNRAQRTVLGIPHETQDGKHVGQQHPWQIA